MKKLLAIGAVLALIGVLAAPMAALAAGTGDTTVTGTLAFNSLDISPPEAIVLGSLYGSSGDASGTSATPGTVLSTSASGYALAIKSNDSDGKMVRQTGSEKLNAALKVTPTLATGTGAAVTNAGLSAVTVLNSDQTVGSTTAGSPTESGTNTVSLTVAQPKQITGTPGTYSITLTFTVSANP